MIHLVPEMADPSPAVPEHPDFQTQLRQRHRDPDPTCGSAHQGPPLRVGTHVPGGEHLQRGKDR